MVTQYRVQDGQELAHASHQGHFLRLAGMNEALVEGTNGRIAACGRHRRHVRAERTGARPPQIRRLPRRVPLSQLNGHTPTKALMPWRLERPEFRQLAIRVRVLTGPMRSSSRGPPSPATRHSRGCAGPTRGLSRRVGAPAIPRWFSGHVSRACAARGPGGFAPPSNISRS